MSELIVVGASAGGIEALGELIAVLPRDLGAPMLVVVHVPPRFPSRLPEVLARRTELNVAHAVDGERLRSRTIRIAPPDHHLVVRDGLLHLARTPKENRHRPSIDVLFRSAAGWYDSAAVGVILSGGPGDGVAGAVSVEQQGGVLLVQDPGEALVGALPESVIGLAEQSQIGSARELGRILGEMAGTPTARSEVRSTRSKEVTQMEHAGLALAEGWRPSVFACPDCTGVLWERDDGRLVRFRCRIGHAYGPEALLEGKGEELESALWSAINTMEERGQLAERLAKRAKSQGLEEASNRYSVTASDMTRQAQQIRELLAAWADPRLDPMASPPHQPETKQAGLTEPAESTSPRQT